ncbi:YitT family protein [Streptomyces sp. NPDC007808]|uniref:YczE/YyaS/YitT family protein n=1 Tax=Streptomyces sp. NPDC007808 TaxID=3364779 RepID=UPI0036AECDD6
MLIHRERRNNHSIYLAGCLVFSGGAYLFIHSQLGTDPLDVFALGLLEHLPVTVGLSQATVAALCLAVVAAWTGTRPLLSPLFTFFFCGSVIDLLRWSDPAHGLPIPAAATLACAVLLCAYGSALIIMSGFGIRAIDLLALTMTSRWRWPFWAAKGLIETSLMTLGFLMGGPLGIGTICFLVGVDLLIQPFMKIHSKTLGNPAGGLLQNSARPARRSAGAIAPHTIGAHSRKCED